MSEQSDSEEGMSSINWWLDFFADAGIPPTSAAEYAVSFAEQRIPQEYEIILELGTDEWRELGVTVLGDRLAMKNLAKSGGKTKMVRAFFNYYLILILGAEKGLEENEKSCQRTTKAKLRRILEHFHLTRKEKSKAVGKTKCRKRARQE